MFDFNTLFPSSNIKAQKEKADVIIRSWKAEHEKEYAIFIERIDNISHGDLSILYDLFLLVEECVPPEEERQPIPFVSKPITEYHDDIWNMMPLAVKSYVTDIAKNGKVYQTNNLPIEEQCKELVKDCLTFIQSASYLAIGFLHIVRELVGTQKNPLIYCMYYFVVFDYGLTRIMHILDKIATTENIDQEDLLMIRTCIGYIVPNSMELGKETKHSWEDASENCDSELWKEIAFALRSSKGNRGIKKSILAIDELLIGDKDALKTSIRQFLLKHTEPIALAYLLRALINANKINANLKYTSFHRAIEQFSGKKYGIDVPQKRFGELKAFSLRSPQKGKSFSRAKEIVDEWTTIFRNIS